MNRWQRNKAERCCDPGNWDTCYELGYTDGMLGRDVRITNFLEKGSRQRRLYHWYWSPYMMGYRDGKGDVNGTD